MNKIINDPFPTLKTERLILRQLNQSDENEIFAMRSNDENAKYLDRPKANSVEDARNFIIKINDGIKNNESFYWGVSIKDNPKLTGTICLWNISEDKTKAEIGFELLPECKGKGIMFEATKKVIDYGFNVLNLETIEGEVDPANSKSIKLMKKFNFKLKTSSNENDEDNNSKTVFYILERELR